MRVTDALAEARQLGLARLDAQVLLAHHLGRSRSWLLAHDDESLEAALLDAYRHDARRRAQGVPLAYLTGEREFHGLTLAVRPGVLVPRPETELLVDWALDVLAGGLGGVEVPRVADLGTGSGAIALAVKCACPRAEILASDADATALEVTTHNARRLGLALEVLPGDWWAAVGDRGVHLALSNPPYVAADDPHLEALWAEPRHALVSGPDGLTALRNLVDGASGHLEAEGWLLLEHGHDQAAAVRRLLAEHGFVDVDTRRDLAGIERCTGGRWPFARPGP